jgi:hypothetical protein
LSKTTWKKVDYVWLAVAAIGLAFGASNHRYAVAKANAEQAERLAVDAHQHLRLEFFLDSQTACSPPALGNRPPAEAARLQSEYAALCDFNRKGLAAMDGMVPPEPLPIRIEPPDVKDADLRWKVFCTTVELAYFERCRAELVHLRAEATHSWLDNMGPWLAPTLLIIALALRITKVTADLADAAKESAPQKATSG